MASTVEQMMNISERLMSAGISTKQYAWNPMVLAKATKCTSTTRRPPDDTAIAPEQMEMTCCIVAGRFLHTIEFKMSLTRHRGSITATRTIQTARKSELEAHRQQSRKTERTFSVHARKAMQKL